MKDIGQTLQNIDIPDLYDLFEDDITINKQKYVETALHDFNSILKFLKSNELFNGDEALKIPLFKEVFNFLKTNGFKFILDSEYMFDLGTLKSKIAQSTREDNDYFINEKLQTMLEKAKNQMFMDIESLENELQREGVKNKYESYGISILEDAIAQNLATSKKPYLGHTKKKKTEKKTKKTKKTSDAKQKITVKELKTICKNNNISGYSKMNKSSLLKTCIVNID
jgi:hypothetical protein